VTQFRLKNLLILFGKVTTTQLAIKATYYFYASIKILISL